MSEKDQQANQPGRLWAIVLAAGEGSRMLPLTRALYGHALPKQFAAFGGSRTFLQQTMDRISPVIPADRTVVVVSETYEEVARSQLRDRDGVEIVAQPCNAGTAPGILLPLAHVLARDPSAHVVIFPSDHHVQRPDAFQRAVREALRTAATSPSGVALVGANADRPATEFGWIVPASCADTNGAADAVQRISRFVEKPHAALAVALLQSGALWSTMVVAGGAYALWRLSRRHLPSQTREFERYLLHVGGHGEKALRHQIYGSLAPADFSHDVLGHAPGLGLVAMTDAGWSDCGTPERLVECIGGAQVLTALAAALAVVDRRGGRGGLLKARSATAPVAA